MKKIGAALLILMLLGGCMKTPGSEPGPKHRWFNPNGQEIEDVVPDACDVGDFPAPPDPPLPPSDGIPAGFHRATFHLNVDAIKIVGPGLVHDRFYCIPVSIHAFVTANGLTGTVVETSDSGVVNHTTPWDGLRNTPWRATIVVAWAPDTNPPVMNFDLIARFEQGQGLSVVGRPADAGIGLSCRIRQNEATFAMTFSSDIFLPAGEERQELTIGPTVRCRPPAFTAQPF